MVDLISYVNFLKTLIFNIARTISEKRLLRISQYFTECINCIEAQNDLLLCLSS